MRGRAGSRSFAAVAAGLLMLAGVRLDAADARSLYQLGRRAHSSEDWPVAIEQYRAALAANPAYLEAAVGLAETLLALEQFEEAAKWAARARQLDTENPDLAVLEGRIRLGAGDVAGARALFNGVVKTWPNNLEARFGLAEADVAEGRTGSALDRYGAALKVAPLSRRGLLSLAILSEAAGDRTTADRAITDALRSHAADVSVQLAASDLYAGRGRWDLAERHARAALAIAPESAAARRALATAQIALGRFDEAAGALREVVALDRGDAQAWYTLGIAPCALGRSRESPRRVRQRPRRGTGRRDRPDRPGVHGDRRAEGRGPPAGEARRVPPRRGPRSWRAAACSTRRSRNTDGRCCWSPHSRDGRVGYARVSRAMGFPDKQLSELKVLVGLGVRDAAVLDEVEGLTAELDGTVSRLWGVDQYAIERQRHLIAVSTIEGASPLRHPLAARPISPGRSGTRCPRHDSLAVTGGRLDRRRASTRPSERPAGRAPTTSSCSACEESERTFAASATLYLARTGASVAVVQRVPHRKRPGARRVPAHRAAGRGSAARPRHARRAPIRPRPRRPRHHATA